MITIAHKTQSGRETVIDFRDGMYHDVQLVEDTTVVISPAPPPDSRLTIRFTQNLGRARVSWPSDVKWRVKVDCWGVPLHEQPTVPEVELRPDWSTIFLIHVLKSGFYAECAGLFRTIQHPGCATMIVELLIGSATAVTIVSLFVANAIDKRHAPRPRLTEEAVAEKRRILTEQRRLWFESWEGADKKKDRVQAQKAWPQVERLDRELLALLDEDRE